MIADLHTAVRHIIRIVHRVFRGAGELSLICSSVVVAMVTLFIAPVPANAQSTPEPPTLCVEESGNCGDSSDGDGSNAGGKKWNPGHYIKAQGKHASAKKEEYLSVISNQIVKVTDSPEIRGAQMAYAWGMIETSQGNYDWEPIHRHLDYLADRGRKAIVMIHTKCFGNDCASLAPVDMQTEVYVTPKERPTLIVELWEEQNMDRYIEFWQAMAAEFDGHPALEMVHGQESTPSLQGTNPANYSKGNYATQLKRMYAAQGAAFTQTNVVANINFLRGEVADLVEHAYEADVGRGMPDTFDSEGTFIFRGDCDGQNCGKRDYRGLLPHLGIISHQQLIGNFGPETDSPAETIAYALENGITHVSWVSSESGEDSWANILDAIESTNPDSHTGCPLAYANGCQ
jgi:hypothetical protein